MNKFNNPFGFKSEDFEEANKKFNPPNFDPNNENNYTIIGFKDFLYTVVGKKVYLIEAENIGYFITFLKELSETNLKRAKEVVEAITDINSPIGKYLFKDLRSGARIISFIAFTDALDIETDEIYGFTQSFIERITYEKDYKYSSKKFSKRDEEIMKIWGDFTNYDNGGNINQLISELPQKFKCMTNEDVNSLQLTYERVKILPKIRKEAPLFEQQSKEKMKWLKEQYNKGIEKRRVEELNKVNEIVDDLAKAFEESKNIIKNKGKNINLNESSQILQKNLSQNNQLLENNSKKITEKETTKNLKSKEVNNNNGKESQNNNKKIEKKIEKKSFSFFDWFFGAKKNPEVGNVKKEANKPISSNNSETITSNNNQTNNQSVNQKNVQTNQANNNAPVVDNSKNKQNNKKEENKNVINNYSKNQTLVHNLNTDQQKNNTKDTKKDYKNNK